jgi:hypothetical protein
MFAWKGRLAIKFMNEFYHYQFNGSGFKGRKIRDGNNSTHPIVSVFRILG